MEANLKNSVAKGMVKTQMTQSHEDRVRENRRVFEIVLAQIEFDVNIDGIKISCDGNQRNFQIEIEGVPQETCDKVSEALDKMFTDIREKSLMIGNTIMECEGKIDPDEILRVHREQEEAEKLEEE